MPVGSTIRQLFPDSPVVLDRKDEQRLVAACLNGDRRAMETLIKHFERPVYNVAFRLLSNADDAADVTQTTFLKVFQKLAQYNPDFKFFSWIYRIAMNESIDLLKQRPRSESLRDEGASAEPGPRDRSSTDQVNEQLRIALSELSEDYRTVVALKYFAGLSYQQMARMLGVAEKTVKSRLYTARQNLRATLERQGIGRP